MYNIISQLLFITNNIQILKNKNYNEKSNFLIKMLYLRNCSVARASCNSEFSIPRIPRHRFPR